MIKILVPIALVGILPSACAKDLILKAKFDSTQADTVEDAAWNCIVDFADDNDGKVCGRVVTRGPIQKFADMCAMGNVLLFDTLHYEYCREVDIKKNGKSFHPHKRPCMRCNERSKAKPTVTTTTVININIIEDAYTAPTTVTVAPSGEPLATVTLFPHPQKTNRVATAKESIKTTLKTIIKTATVVSDPSPAARTCLPKPERGSDGYDNGE